MLHNFLKFTSPYLNPILMNNSMDVVTKYLNGTGFVFINFKMVLGGRS